MTISCAICAFDNKCHLGFVGYSCGSFPSEFSYRGLRVRL